MLELDGVQTMDGRVNYSDRAQRIFEAVNRLLGTAQQLFDAANELRKVKPTKRTIGSELQQVLSGCGTRSRSDRDPLTGRFW
jgi:hypothetical protein